MFISYPSVFGKLTQRLALVDKLHLQESCAFDPKIPVDKFAKSLTSTDFPLPLYSKFLFALRNLFFLRIHLPLRS
jgi:hypothetical protein